MFRNQREEPRREGHSEIEEHQPASRNQREGPRHKAVASQNDFSAKLE